MNKEIEFTNWCTREHHSSKRFADNWINNDTKEEFTTQELWDKYVETDQYKYYSTLRRNSLLAWGYFLLFIMTLVFAVFIADQNSQYKTVINDYHYNFQQQKFNEWKQSR